MVTQRGYIHINEAVKVFNRTRQTFYNYINKGLVDTKKVNNKVYLKVKDIEKLLSAYLPEREETSEDSQIEMDEGVVETIKEVETSLAQTHEEVGNFKNILNNELDTFKEDLLIEIKNTLYHYQEELQQKQHNLINQIATRLTTPTDSKAYLQTRKYQFYLGYLGFVAINIILLGFLY